MLRRPRWAASATAWARLSAPSFRNSEPVWNFTVRSLMPSACAICLAGQPLGDQPQHLALAGGERGRPRAATRTAATSRAATARLQRRPAGRDGPDRPRDLGGGGALQQVALRARPDRAQHALVGVVGGEDQDPRRGLASSRRGIASTPLMPGSSRSSSTHVRLQPPDQRQRVLGRAGRADDLEVGLVLERGDQPLAHDRVVVDHQRRGSSRSGSVGAAAPAP